MRNLAKIQMSPKRFFPPPPPPPVEMLLESLHTESSDMEGLQIFAHGAILCPNWTHLYTVSLWEIHANFHIIACLWKRGGKAH